MATQPLSNKATVGLTFLSFLLLASPTRSATLYEPLLKDLRSSDSTVRVRAAGELGAACGSAARKSEVDYRKITRELESALPRESCGSAISDSCSVFRGVTRAVARCSAAEGRFSRVLLGALGASKPAEVQLELESEIGRSFVDLLKSHPRTEKYDPLRSLIDDLREDPNQVGLVLVVVTASRESAIDGVHRSEKDSEDPLTGHLDRLLTEASYPKLGTERPLLQQVKIALAASLARSLARPERSDGLTKVLFPSGELAGVTKKLLDSPACRVNLISALTVRLRNGGVEQAPFLLRLLEEQGPSTNQVKTGTPTPSAQISVGMEAARRQEAILELLRQKDPLLPRLKVLLFRDDVPLENLEAIIRPAVHDAVLDRPQLVSELAEWGGDSRQENQPQTKQQEIVRLALQRGIADALGDTDRSVSDRIRALDFCAGDGMNLLLPATPGQDRLFGGLAELLGPAPLELRSAALKLVRLLFEKRLTNDSDFLSGADRHFVDALLVASREPALRHSPEFCSFAKVLLPRLKFANVPRDKAWLLTDLLLRWSQPELSAILPFDPAAFAVEFDGWLRGLTVEGPEGPVATLDGWKKWWQVNKYNRL